MGVHTFWDIEVLSSVRTGTVWGTHVHPKQLYPNWNSARGMANKAGTPNYESVFYLHDSIEYTYRVPFETENHFFSHHERDVAFKHIRRIPKVRKPKVCHLTSQRRLYRRQTTWALLPINPRWPGPTLRLRGPRDNTPSWWLVVTRVPLMIWEYWLRVVPLASCTCVFCTLFFFPFEMFKRKPVFKSSKWNTNLNVLNRKNTNSTYSKCTRIS